MILKAAIRPTSSYQSNHARMLSESHTADSLL